MSFERPLRGFCSCRRNRYIIQPPAETNEVAQVLFDTDPFHRASQANPLTAFIRVPLTWYQSATFSFYPDETASTIKRVFEHPFEESRRQFCGYCATPLTFWTESPRSEADYIHVTLGSLCRDDLGDLEEMGLIPQTPESENEEPAVPIRSEPVAGSTAAAPTTTTTTALAPARLGRETLGVPWFDSLLAGSKLGQLRTSKGSHQSRDGNTRVEWEVYEWTEGGDGDDDEDEGGAGPAKNGKRKRGDREDVDDARMEGIDQ